MSCETISDCRFEKKAAGIERGNMVIDGSAVDPKRAHAVRTALIRTLRLLKHGLWPRPWLALRSSQTSAQRQRSRGLTDFNDLTIQNPEVVSRQLDRSALERGIGVASKVSRFAEFFKPTLQGARSTAPGSVCP